MTITSGFWNFISKCYLFFLHVSSIIGSTDDRKEVSCPVSKTRTMFIITPNSHLSILPSRPLAVYISYLFLCKASLEPFRSLMFCHRWKSPLTLENDVSSKSDVSRLSLKNPKLWRKDTTPEAATLLWGLLFTKFPSHFIFPSLEQKKLK